jgi:CRP-like cAMP-binding protein
METKHSVNSSFIQLPGSGISIRAKALLEQYSDGFGELRQYLQRGIQGLLTQTAQTAACNRLHDFEERFSCWLLMCRDRAQGEVLPITHEFLAMMLATRRSTVTVATGMLDKAGLIERARGRVEIVNRAGLEEVACECYGIVRDEYVRLGLL